MLLHASAATCEEHRRFLSSFKCIDRYVTPIELLDCSRKNPVSEESSNERFLLRNDDDYRASGSKYTLAVNSDAVIGRSDSKSVC
jgi:hypothetical protein